MVPRLPDVTGTIRIKIKKTGFSVSSALSSNLGPHKVLQVASWLADNSTL